MILDLNLREEKKIDWVKITKVVDYALPGKEFKNCQLWQTARPYCSIFKYRDTTFTIYIDVGTVWDGASVPRWAWSASGITPRGIHDGGTLMHDLLYVTKGNRNYHPKFKFVCVYDNYQDDIVVCDRRTCDILMYSAWKELTKFDHRAHLAYAAVRVGGERHFGRKTPQLKGVK